MPKDPRITARARLVDAYEQLESWRDVLAAAIEEASTAGVERAEICAILGVSRATSYRMQTRQQTLI